MSTARRGYAVWEHGVAARRYDGVAVDWRRRSETCSENHDGAVRRVK